MILDFLFPKTCLGCGSGGIYICDSCLNDVLLNGWFENNCSIFKHEGVIRKVIISLKYKFAHDLTDELVERVVEVIKTNPKFDNLKSNFVLVPIPLHKQRENWRGFNQSELIGERVAKKMTWEYFPDLLIRNKNTVPQINLKGLERRSNLSGVFSYNPNHSINTKSKILLFDDVYTTGSTISEAKKTLNQAGIKNIKSLTVAR